jgi:hypothetical protein
MLINNMLEFTNTVNKQFETLIAFVKSQEKDPSTVDTNSKEFLSAFHHEKLKFDFIGVNNSSLKTIQTNINRSKSELFKKKALYESAKESYNVDSTKLHALQKIEDMLTVANNQRMIINKEKDDLKREELILKKRMQHIRLVSSSIDIDGWQSNNMHKNIVNIDEEVLDYGIIGDDSTYNNGVDQFMNDM